MPGETKSYDDLLVPYGIMEEKSDIRAHVGAFARRIFVFQTDVGRRVANSGKYKLVPAYQDGVVGPTSFGWPVPICDIPDLRMLNYASWPWDSFPFNGSESSKGAAAVKIVVSLLRVGRFPLWISTHDDERETVQIKGTDLVVFAKQLIQVKCDLKAGLKEHSPRCTGNLFIQKCERNPLGKH